MSMVEVEEAGSEAILVAFSGPDMAENSAADATLYRHHELLLLPTGSLEPRSRRADESFCQVCLGGLE
jgi:hypothetical protein